MNILIDALKAIASPVCLEAADRLADALRQTAMGPGPTLRSFSASYNPGLTDAGVPALAACFPARDV
ncbi:hypothetical protein C1J03_19370 [Sulfitobacter sp. SK012]|uniref:hypothetical protein n=1 Tax=Sulfitobacter sp. SK012 TaxID=1389005 RepID=UPI000E0A2EC5|nr:hypothetical protein [Sulfitobacter sp. SK012]AXI47969.1 hypothetical protein C1J03_19370 [Sulfitobacter sp. SK012]